jgi:hypothetical protein
MGDNTVANTIYQQLGGVRFAVLTGSKWFKASDSGISFKLSRNASGANFCNVSLNGNDYYDMQFIRLRKHRDEIKQKVVAEFEDIGCEQLQEVFRNVTGLETRCPRFVGGRE